MNSQATPTNDSSFSFDKGLVDPLSEYQQRIDDYLENSNKEATVRYLNKKKKSKFWKMLTSNII